MALPKLTSSDAEALAREKINAGLAALDAAELDADAIAQRTGAVEADLAALQVQLAPYVDLVGSAPDRPGDGRTLFTRDMTGDPKSRPPIDRGTVANGGELGQVLRISGADIDPDTGFIEVAPRRHYYIQDYRTYQIQHEFARHRDPLDPQNHAVELRIQLLRSDLSAIRTLRLGSPYAPTKAQGPQSINTFIGKRGASGTISFVVTDEAAYAVPYFRIYGNGAETDLGSVRLLDVTFALDGGVDNTLILDRLRKLEADQASGFSTGFVSRPTWSSGGDEETALALTTPVPFTIGEVPDDDKGFHDGIPSEAGYNSATGKVPNGGRYAPVGTPPVWRRTGDTTAKAAAAALLANSVVKTSIGDAEYILIPGPDLKTTSLITFSDFASALEARVAEKFIPHTADATVGTAPVVLIPADADRNNVQIINTSATDALLIGFGSPPVEGARHTLPVLPPGGGYEQRYCRTDAIYAMAKTGSVSVFANYTNRSGVDVVGDMVADVYLARGSGRANAGEKAAIKRLINRFRESGAFYKFRAAAILANIDTITAAQDLVRDIAWSRFNTPTFTKYQGYRGNGVDSYISTNYVPNGDTGHFSAASHSFGAYVDDTLQPSTGTPTTMGSTTTGISANRSNNQATTRSATASSDLITVGGRGGLFAVNRTREASYRAIYKQTAQDVATPISSTGLGGVPYEMFVLAQNSSASGAVQFSTIEVAFAFAGEAMTDAQLFSIDAAVAEYKATLATLGA